MITVAMGATIHSLAGQLNVTDPGQDEEPAMATNKSNPVTPLPFIDALLGYQRTAAIKAAIELGVFDAIGAHGADVEAVCAKTNTSARGARILCDYLTVLGFLESPEPSGGRHL